MRKALKLLGWTFLAFIIVAAYPAYRIGFGHPFTINQLANRQALIFLLHNPELFTSVGIGDGTIFDFHSGKLAAVGVAKRDADYALTEKMLHEVQEFDRSALSHQDQITYDVLVNLYEGQLAFKKFDWLSSEGLYPISPMFGTEVQLKDFMLSQHVIKNMKTARNYVSRLQAMGDKLDGVTAEMQREAGAGVRMPVSLLDKSVTVIKDIISPAPPENPLVTTFTERMSKVDSIDEQARDELTTRATTAVREVVYPAYQRMIAALEQARPQSLDVGDGVGRLPDGAEYYAAMLKQMTTSDYTPDQVHELGLSEVARIETEMDTILRDQGLVEGSVGARVKQLAKDPRYLYPNTDAGRADVLARYQQILDEVNARMPEYFATVPAARLLVQRVPEASEKGQAAAYYSPPAMDGSRGAVFFVNLRDLWETPKWGMKTISYHEGIPGHHFQIATAQGLEGLPLVRQMPLYSGYVEGWALYAERLAWEIGMYDGDPLGNLGRLQAEMFRAVRLVVDSGLHAKGWTREAAIDYMVDKTGMSESEVESEIERYMALPGQACAYKIGQLKILELREKAKAALGASFDLKAFHHEILGNGALPLTLLEREVDAWIAEQAAKSKPAAA